MLGQNLLRLVRLVRSLLLEQKSMLQKKLDVLMAPYCCISHEEKQRNSHIK